MAACDPPLAGEVLLPPEVRGFDAPGAGIEAAAIFTGATCPLPAAIFELVLPVVGWKEVKGCEGVLSEEGKLPVGEPPGC